MASILDMLVGSMVRNPEHNANGVNGQIIDAEQRAREERREKQRAAQAIADSEARSDADEQLAHEAELAMKSEADRAIRRRERRARRQAEKQAKFARKVGARHASVIADTSVSQEQNDALLRGRDAAMDARLIQMRASAFAQASNIR